ncbi:MAG: hypothetical protein SO314_08325 [Alphaproteobacteria bacterium]|nr:hypothetical protein [Alphaproteobacteria bacterium]
MTNNIMLHMKLNSAVAAAALLAFLPTSFMFVSPARAGVCFLPDCDLSGTLPVVCIDCDWCENNGYYFNCPDGTAADYSQTCYRDETYTKCSEDQYCKNKGYDKTSEYCRALGPTWYADETKQCPNGLELYKECKEDTGRACEEDNKFMTCAVGRPSKNDSEICEWDSNYAECCTDTPSYDCPENSKVEGCEDGTVVGKDSCGYECHQCCTTSCPSGYAYTDAQTDGMESGYIKDMDDESDYCNHCTLGKLYKRKENPCTGYDVCSAYGGVDNGDYCYTGSVQKYSKCLTECRPGLIEWCDTPVTDCTTLGYNSDKSACDGQLTAVCPFNTEKAFCETPCSYTVTAESCAAQCLNAGSNSCTKNGVTYYESCGSSKCGTGYTCTNGSCVSTCTYTYTASSCSSQCKNVGSTSCVKDGMTYYSSCGSSKCSSSQTCRNGTCKSSMQGRGYYCCDSGHCGGYSDCMQYYYDCSSYHADCQDGGGTPVYDGCTYIEAQVSNWVCQ